MTTSSIVVARAELAAAEAAQREERRAGLVAQLVRVREEIRTKQPAYEALCNRIIVAQNDLDNVRAEILSVDSALSRLGAAKPEVAAFLPDDPETKTWEHNCAELRKELEQLRTRRSAIGSVELQRIEAVNLREELRALRYAETNTLRLLNNEVAPTSLHGEVRGV